MTDRAEVGLPAVTWPEGRGTGRWDTNSWVRTLRDAMARLDAAINTGDFSGPELSDLFPPGLLARFAQEAANMSPDDSYAPGPTPFAVLDVTESEDAAVVAMCETTVWQVRRASDVRSPDSLAAGRGEKVAWELAQRSDGTRHVTGIVVSDYPAPLCPTAGAVVGYFDPAPPYGEWRREVIGTDGRIVQPLDPFGRPREE
ncbi:MAG: hypothetical protein ABW025_00225 [Cellulomonas sp.]